MLKTNVTVTLTAQNLRGSVKNNSLNPISRAIKAATGASVWLHPARTDTAVLYRSGMRKERAVTLPVKAQRLVRKIRANKAAVTPGVSFRLTVPKVALKTVKA